MQRLRRFGLRRVVALLLLVLLGYANILGNQFTNWDDEHLIVRNKVIREFQPLTLVRFFHISYPPLSPFSHSLDYFFWRLNPAGFHITDLVIYALVVLCFFLLCSLMTGSVPAAFAAAALFSLHPLHVESVAWLSSRKDGLGMLFYLLAFLAYLRSKGAIRSFACWLGAFFYLCALWAKPLTATLPLVLILYDLILARRAGWRAIIANKLPYAIPLGLTAVAAILFDPRNELFIQYPAGGPYRTFLMMPTVLADYLRMLFLPVNLSALYVVTVPDSLIGARCLLSFGIVLGILACAVACIRRLPLFSFSILWGFVSLLPVLQIVPVNVVKADRYLYLPTAAFCVLLGWIFSRVQTRKAQAVIVAALTVFLILTIDRNRVWRDSASLWESVILLDPANADAFNNLGIALTREGDHSGAERALRRAIALRPDFPAAHNNLGNILRLAGRFDEALGEFRNAMGLTRDIVYAASVHIGLGMTYEGMGEYARALESYREALRLNPAYLDDSVVWEHIAHCEKMK